MTLATIAARVKAAGVPYLTRSEWGATASLGPPMTLPARESWVHHSVTIADDDGDMLATADVAADMRELERVGVARFGRFSYSFAVHPSGVVGEGAGFTIGAHTANHNSDSFGIVAIGNYSTTAPPAPMLRAFAVLLAVLEAEGLLAPGSHPTGGHRDTKATGCPGDLLYARLGEMRALADDPALLNPPQENDDMRVIVKGDTSLEWWITDGITKDYIESADIAGGLAWIGLARWDDATKGPITVGQAWIDSIPARTLPAVGDIAKAVVAALPPGSTSGIDAADVEAALRKVLAPVFDAV